MNQRQASSCSSGAYQAYSWGQDTERDWDWTIWIIHGKEAHHLSREILIDSFISNWVQAPMVPMDLGLKNGSFVPHNLIPVQGSPVTLLKFQIAPGLKLLISSGSKKTEPRYTCLSEAKASNSQRKWAEVSSSAPQLLYKGLLVSPTK
jgi:hypothetical protein